MNSEKIRTAMTPDLSHVQEMAEKLNDAIADLPIAEKEELGDTLYQQVDLDLGDLQNLLSATRTQNKD